MKSRSRSRSFNEVSVSKVTVSTTSLSLLICDIAIQLLLHFLSQFFTPLLGRTTVDLGAGVEQPFVCLIIQNRQAVQSMRGSMDWTLQDNMVDGLFFCATLTGRRGGHTPFVQAGAETPDTSAEAAKPDPSCSFRGEGAGVGMKMRSLVGLSAHFPFHWWSAQCAARMLLLSDKLMSYSAKRVTQNMSASRNLPTLGVSVTIQLYLRDSKFRMYQKSATRLQRQVAVPIYQEQTNFRIIQTLESRHYKASQPMRMPIATQWRSWSVSYPGRPFSLALPSPFKYILHSDWLLKLWKCIN